MNIRAILIAILALLASGVSAQSEIEGGKMLPKDSLRLDGYIPSKDSPLMEHDSLLLLKHYLRRPEYKFQSRHTNTSTLYLIKRRV